MLTEKLNELYWDNEIGLILTIDEVEEHHRIYCKDHYKNITFHEWWETEDANRFLSLADKLDDIQYEILDNITRCDNEEWSRYGIDEFLYYSNLLDEIKQGLKALGWSEDEFNKTINEMFKGVFTEWKSQI